MPSRKDVTIQFAHGSYVTAPINVADAFVFCASTNLDERIGKKLGYDAYYKIVNIEKFAETLFEKIYESCTLVGFKANKVNYSNKEVTITGRNELNRNKPDFWSLCFTKNTDFFDEKEFRIIFNPMFTKKTIKPIIITCPELIKYCIF